MNKIKYFLGLAWLALVASCTLNNPDYLGGMTVSQDGSNGKNAVYMGNVNPTGVISTLATTIGEANFTVTPRLALKADKSVTLELGVDTAALVQYNKANKLRIKPVKAEDVVFIDDNNVEVVGKIKVTINPGEVQKVVKGKLHGFTAENYSYDSRYAIPIKILSVSGAYKLLPSPTTTIINLNREITTSVFYMIEPGGGGYTQRISLKNDPKVLERYKEEMTEWTMQYIAQFNSLNRSNMTTASLSAGHGFYNRISTTSGLQIKSENRDGVDTWTNKPVKEGEWLYVTYVYRKKGLVGDLSVYVNGVFQRSFTTSLLYISNKPDKNGQYDGWGFGNENMKNFYLRELRFWSRALTEAEILDKSYLPEDPNAYGLEAYFPMTEESFDKESKKFIDQTGRWEWRIRDNAQWKFVSGVNFPSVSYKEPKNN